MKKFWIQLALLLVVILGSLYVTFGGADFANLVNLNTSGDAVEFDKKTLKVGDSSLSVEIADSPQKRAKGLANRDSLESNSGMLFVFPTEKKYQFWMKSVKIPLDFIFIRKGKVVDILKDIQPPPSPDTPDSELTLYAPVIEVDMVLEVPAGYILDHNIQVGDSVALVK